MLKVLGLGLAVKPLAAMPAACNYLSLMLLSRILVQGESSCAGFIVAVVTFVFHSRTRHSEGHE